MPIYRSNSEYWYVYRVGVLKRLRRWLISTGWEAPHWTRAGYSYKWQALHSIHLSLRARGHRSRPYAFYISACPLSLFGGRLTFHHFGVDWYSRKRTGWYCLHWGSGQREWTCYRSHNATPWGADRWYIGAPDEVVRAANAQAEKMTADREHRESRDERRATTATNGSR